MATWHQQKAIAARGPLIIRTWTIVTNPPGRMRTHMSGFPSREAAQACLNLWAANGNDEVAHSHIAAPDAPTED